MKQKPYLGMRPGDLDGKRYARFWQPEMRPLQPQVARAVERGGEAPGLCLGLADADQLLAPGNLPLENGFSRLEDGTLFVAARTNMPQVTGAMFEWWMGWHYMENQRYKLWHPGAHLENGTAEMRGDDTKRSDREKYRTTHRVTEYVGKRVEKITITFHEPGAYFSDLSCAEENGTTALVCGRVRLQRAPVTIGHLIHQIREADGESEMRSRFWLGRPQIDTLAPDNPLNRLLRSGPVSQLALPPRLGRDMLIHCGMEMHHLARFLPNLYAEYHPE
jgi:hypothetical protein